MPTLIRILSLFAALFAATVASAAPAPCDLDCSLATMLAEEKLAGVVYALVDGDQVRTGAVGLANAETGAKLTPDARVHIGSVAKTFLALGVLRLVTERRVDLDAPVEAILPSIRFDNPWPQSPVTVRHLLDHTSGLDDTRLWMMFSARTAPDAPLADAFTRDPSVLRIRTEPGTQMSYSNMGYTLAGMVVEAATGERYEAFLDRELLRPLRMDDTTFAFVAQADDPRLAWGHDDKLRVNGALPVQTRPAAQVTTTAGDMALLANLLVRNDSALIDPALIARMARPTTTDAARAGLSSGYALGLARRDRNGVAGDCHGGSIVGFRAMLCLYREHGKAFFIAHNTDSETAQYARFDARMIEALGLPTIAPSAPANLDSPRYVLDPSRFQTFRYFDLFGASPPVGTMSPIGERLLQAPDRTEPSHVRLPNDRLSDGTRTWRRQSTLEFVAYASSAILGLLGMLYFALPRRRPGFVAIVLLLVAAALFPFQSFIEMADRTPASIALFIATAALPIAMLAQLAIAIRARRKLEAFAAAAVAQWCVVLAVFGLLPFALWR